MSEKEQFVWLGPVSTDASAGRVARAFVLGLTRAGVKVAVLDTGDGAIESPFDVDGEVRAAGTTVVRQGSLSEIARSTSILPLSKDARQVAYIVADRTELAPRDVEFLAACDEIWAPSFTQCELLAALGVARRKLAVIAPGRTVKTLARTRSQGPRHLVVIGASASGTTGMECVASRACPGSVASGLEIEEADAIVLAADSDPWGVTALDVFSSGKPVVCAATGAALELADPGDCLWLEKEEPWHHTRVLGALQRDWDELSARAERLRARLGTMACERSAAMALLERTLAPRALPEERLDRVLADLGWPTAAERLAGSRPRVEIVAVTSAEGTWTATLAHHLRRAAPDTTVVLWVDSALESETERITRITEQAIEKTGRASEELDVLIVTAPVAHAPRERLVVEARVSAA